MEFIDYYLVLKLPPNATSHDIKKAFRQMAMEFHPDKHGNNPAKTQHFNLVKDAYHTLVDEQKRQLYNNRYYLFKGENKTDKNIDTLMLDTEKLKRWLYANNQHQLNYEQLQHRLDSILASMNRLTIKHTAKQEQLLFVLKDVAAALPYNHITPLVKQLAALSPSQHFVDEFNKLLDEKRKQMQWENFKGILAIIIATVTCAVIFILSS